MKPSILASQDTVVSLKALLYRYCSALLLIITGDYSEPSFIVFRPTMVSCEARVMGLISMTEPSKLVKKAIGRPNATQNIA